MWEASLRGRPLRGAVSSIDRLSNPPYTGSERSEWSEGDRFVGVLRTDFEVAPVCPCPKGKPVLRWYRAFCSRGCSVPDFTDLTDLTDLADFTDLTDLATPTDLPNPADDADSAEAESGPLGVPETVDDLACGSDCCVPDCDKKECGSDGCGGSCGECPDGQDCNPAGKCKG